MARKSKTRSSYLMVSDATWELARAGYLGGETMQQVADRLQIGVHNLRRKISLCGWTKRALAQARATARALDEDGVPPPNPNSNASKVVPDATPTAPSIPDLPATVLDRAREALTAGRGGEASALLKAMREYVIARQDVADAHMAIEDAVALWDTSQPTRAGETTETLMVQTLYHFWSGISLEDHVDRVDPHGTAGLRTWMTEHMPPVPPPAARRRKR